MSQTKDKSKFFKKTMKELGPNLPMGFRNSSGDYIKNLSSKTWTMKTEKEIGKLRDKIKGENIARYITMILSEMCRTIGPHNFAEKDLAEKNIIIGQMLSGDVFYAYMWLRKEAMGSDLKLKIKCANCGDEFELYADLDTIETNCVKDLSDLQFEYELRNPIEIRSKSVKKFLLGPMIWSTYEMMNRVSLKNIGMAKEGIILGSIKKCDGLDGDIVLLESEIDELSKYDVENIIQLISDYSIGPDMSIEGVCEKCGSEFTHGIDWSYDNFFGISSR